MATRFAFGYVMKDEPKRVRAVAPRHAAYWRDLGLPGYLGGPFGDRSGGLITFEATDRSLARGSWLGTPSCRRPCLRAAG